MTYFVIPSEGFTVAQGIIQHPPKRPNPGPAPNPPPNYPPPPTPTQPPPKTNGLGTMLGPPPVQPGPRPSPAGPVPIPPVPPRPHRDGIVGWDEPMDGCPIALYMTSVKGTTFIGGSAAEQDGEPEPEPEPAPTPDPEPEPDRPEPDVPQSPTPDDIRRCHTCSCGFNHGHALVLAHAG